MKNNKVCHVCGEAYSIDKYSEILAKSMCRQCILDESEKIEIIKVRIAIDNLFEIRLQNKGRRLTEGQEERQKKIDEIYRKYNFI